MQHIYKITIDVLKAQEVFYAKNDIGSVVSTLQNYQEATSIKLEKFYIRDHLGTKFQKNPTYLLFRWKKDGPLDLATALKSAFLR